MGEGERQRETGERKVQGESKARQKETETLRKRWRERLKHTQRPGGEETRKEKNRDRERVGETETHIPEVRHRETKEGEMWREKQGEKKPERQKC